MPPLRRHRVTRRNNEIHRYIEVRNYEVLLYRLSPSPCWKTKEITSGSTLGIQSWALS